MPSNEVTVTEDCISQAPVPGRAEASANPGDDAPFRETRAGWLVLGSVWVVCAAYVGLHLRQGWFPADAGTFAQMADRVLHGQVPFRDFIENYTGGLDYLNALAFRLFGTNLFSMRIPLFLFFLAWVPSIYLIARRFVRPLTAGAVTLLCVAWSVPNYPEAMPSWYNLFFATWGILALLRYVETESRRWLWVAGACGGLSFLLKISGLYFVNAALLFFVFRELCLSSGDRGQAPKKATLYRAFVSAGLLLFLWVLVSLISQRPLLVNFIHFVLPSSCLVAILLCGVWRGESCRSGLRFKRLMGMGIPFVAGLLIPIAPLLVWFAAKHALVAWFQDVFMGPAVRLEWAASDPHTLMVAAGLVPAALVLYLAGHESLPLRRLARYGGPFGLGVLLFFAWRNRATFQFLGKSLPLVFPIVAIGLALGFLRLRLGLSRKGQQIFLVSAVAVCCALIQFPLALPLYFCYVAPLAVMAIVAPLPVCGRFDRVALGSLLAVYLVFAVWLHTPAYVELMRTMPGQSVDLRPLRLNRAGGLLVRRKEAAEYERLVHLIRDHARGPYIYCTPDCPEVYFLSGMRNPTGTLFDVLDPDFLDVPGRNGRILSTVRDRGVSVVVIRRREIQSAPISYGLETALDSEFPDSTRVGNFEIRWRLRGPFPAFPKTFP